MNWEHFWWKSVHGPRLFISAIVEYVMSGEAIQIIDTEKSAWRGAMREATQELIAPGITTIRYISAPSAFYEDAGSYLIREFTNSDGYRPHTEHWSGYLKRSGALDSSMLWIYDIEQEHIVPLCKMTHCLKPICPVAAEAKDKNLRIEEFRAVAAGDYITEYDYLSLASQIAAERNDLSIPWRRYLSDLAVELYADDVESILNIIEGYDVNGSVDELLSGSSGASVWKAQLRNAFHLIEEKRAEFIRRHDQTIRECLPEIQFQQEVSDPYHAELGLLCYLTSPKREEKGRRRLFLTREDYENLYFLHDIRNRLAHGETLTAIEMGRLFGR